VSESASESLSISSRSTSWREAESDTFAPISEG
jgi:hypothetical protein